jgi:RNA polymerase sigma-70 factor (ECF subfamily)
VTDEIDSELCLKRVLEHDQDAARALVEQLYPLVIRIVRSHLPRRTAEEDLAQDVFVKLFTRLDQYEARPGVSFEHWVSRLAVRTCLDALRAEKRRPELRWSDLSEEETAWLDYLVAEVPTAPDVSASDTREAVEKLLAQLSPPDRLVINLLDLEQRPVKDIARITGWSVTLVKVRAFRARRKLRALAQALKATETDNYE